MQDLSEPSVEPEARAQPRCFRVIANARAGTVLEAGAENFSHRLEAAFAMLREEAAQGADIAGAELLP